MGAPIERAMDDLIILVSAPVSRCESQRMLLIESLEVGRLFSTDAT